jgi:hypothetical protein
MHGCRGAAASQKSSRSAPARLGAHGGGGPRGPIGAAHVVAAPTPFYRSEKFGPAGRAPR